LSAAVFIALLVIAASVAATIAGCTSQPARPVLILVSIDGWRWDYQDRFQTPALGRFAREGVRAEGLIPVFPSKTFPNHYTIATGLYPAHHGIVSNNMVDPALPGRFTLSNRDVQQDSRWWGGEPIWVTAERQGQVAATMFWPGSDVEIAHHRPTYWRMFDTKVTNEARVDQLLEWLDQPDAKRPTFLTLYFSDVDTAGHDEGPEAPQTRDAALRVDAALDRLRRGVERLRIPGVNYLILSDHGMAALSRDRVIVLDDYIDLARVDLIDSSPILGITPKPGTSAAEIYAALHGKHPALQVYTRSTLPAQYRLTDHPRIAEIIGIADDGWLVTTRRRFEEQDWRSDSEGGAHGYDPKHRSMQGLFIAAGPRFKSGITVPPFENVHVYELMCRVLGLTPAPNDGDPRVTSGFLR
jgi:predicted AlkP superfamily pyrophosphatase or phosphodiesterase